MTKYINSNVSIEEFFRYHCEDDNAIRFYGRIVAEESNTERVIAGLERQLELAEKRLELAEEQVCFAQELLNNIASEVRGYSNTGGAVKLKKLVLEEISESMFER